MVYLNCPRCGLTITPKAAWLTVEHCPRCLARGRVVVSLFASTLAARELYAAGAGPDASDDEAAPLRLGDVGQHREPLGGRASPARGAGLWAASLSEPGPRSVTAHRTDPSGPRNS